MVGRTAEGQPDLNTLGGRLRWARENWARRMGASYSMRAAAAYFGWPENTYKSHEMGERQKKGLKTEYLKKYSKAYGVDAGWLATGLGSPLTKEPRDEMADASPEDRQLAISLLKAARAHK